MNEAIHAYSFGKRVLSDHPELTIPGCSVTTMIGTLSLSKRCCNSFAKRMFASLDRTEQMKKWCEGEKIWFANHCNVLTIAKVARKKMALVLKIKIIYGPEMYRRWNQVVTATRNLNYVRKISR